jgi:uncharacterized membrane protein
MDQPPVMPPTTEMGRPGPANDTSKLLAALGYPLWFPVAIIALLIDPYKNEPFVKVHAYQALALGIAIYVLTFVGSFIIIGPLIGLAGFIYQIVLAVKAWNGVYFEVPVIYGIIKNYVQ